MSKQRKLWRCSSISSCKPPQPFCARCIHATFRGQATINGKRYRWFWQPYYDVVEFKRKCAGNRPPSRTHPVWVAAEKWAERLIVQLRDAPYGGGFFGADDRPKKR
jgi:hypothetical protein